MITVGPATGPAPHPAVGTKVGEVGLLVGLALFGQHKSTGPNAGQELVG